MPPKRLTSKRRRKTKMRLPRRLKPSSRHSATSATANSRTNKRFQECSLGLIPDGGPERVLLRRSSKLRSHSFTYLFISFDSKQPGHYNPGMALNSQFRRMVVCDESRSLDDSGLRDLAARGVSGLDVHNRTFPGSS